MRDEGEGVDKDSYSTTKIMRFRSTSFLGCILHAAMLHALD